MSVAREETFTAAEYLARERAAETRSEYVNGQIYAMAGASPMHNEISINLTSVVWSILRHALCRPYGADQRIGIPATGTYTYPDLSISCPPAEYDPNDPHTLLNPSVLFEILSPSTEAYDRGAKFAHYRRIPSLHEYWLISSDRQRVERYTRRDEEWLLQEFDGPEASVPLDVVPGAMLSLAEIYARVELPERPDQ